MRAPDHYAVVISDQSFSLYHSVMAIKSPSIDPARTHEDALAESIAWNGITERTHHVFRPSNDAQDVAQEIMAYTEELQSRIQDLREEFYYVADKPEVDTVQKMERVTHHYRRLIAGYHQAVELIRQGEFSLATALEDGMVILEGQRCVASSSEFTIYADNLTSDLTQG